MLALSHKKRITLCDTAVRSTQALIRLTQMSRAPATRTRGLVHLRAERKREDELKRARSKSWLQ